MKVKAKQKGYFGGKLRQEDDEFEVGTEKEFSSKWMEKVDGRKKSSVPVSQASL